MTPRTRRSPARTTRALLALATLGTVGAAGACQRAAGGDAQAAAAPQAMQVGAENVALVDRDTVQAGPAISGSLQPERAAAIRAEVGGTVVAAVAEVGQRVARGAVLARLETTGIADQAISARSGVAAAQANYTVALRNAERADRLLAAGAIAARDAEQARAAATASRAQLEGARAQSAQASRQLGNATARAPFAGIVGIKRVSTGDVVNPGAELYTVVDPSSMQLEASVPAEQLAQVKVGAPVRFTVTGYGDRTFTGRITRVAPVADPTTRQVQILATLPNSGNTLVGGLFAEGRVASETRSALVVPADAIDQRGVRPSVVRVRNGKAEKVDVELGLRDDAREVVEIRTGVAQGDTLLRGAARGISIGTPVRVTTVADAGAAQSATPAGAPAGAPSSASPAAPAPSTPQPPR